MGFVGKKAAAVKEASIDAFNFQESYQSVVGISVEVTGVVGISVEVTGVVGISVEVTGVVGLVCSFLFVRRLAKPNEIR